MFSFTRQSGALSVAALLFVLSAAPRPATAQTVWTDADIGNPAVPGSSEAFPGGFTIVAAGGGLTDGYDQVHFTYQWVTGDFDIRTYVAATTGDPSLSTGLMIRDSLAPNAFMAAVMYSPATGIVVRSRTSDNTIVDGIHTAARGLTLLRLARTGGTLTGYRSADGVTWTSIGTVDYGGGDVLLGFTLDSHNPGVWARVMMAAVEIQATPATPAGENPPPASEPPTPPPPTEPPPATPPPPVEPPPTTPPPPVEPPPTTPPPPVEPPPSAPPPTDPPPPTTPPVEPLPITPPPTPPPPPPPTAPPPPPPPADGVPQGTDALVGWSSSTIGDTPTPGSTVLNGTTLSITGSGTGVNSQFDQLYFTYQTITGDAELIAQVDAPKTVTTANRFGLMIRASLAADAATAFIGLSDNLAALFRRRVVSGGTSIDVTPPASPTSWLRLVRLGDVFIAYASNNGLDWRYIGADVVSMGSTVYLGFVASSGQVPDAATGAFRQFWLNAPALGVPPNRPTIVHVTSPVSYALPGDITVTASAQDVDSRVARVDFYVGDQHLGFDTSFPYQVAWEQAPIGTYALTAIATDDVGRQSQSAPAFVFVTPGGEPKALGPVPPPMPPVPKVPIGLRFTPSSDHDWNVTSYTIEVRRDGSSATSASLVTGNLGKPPVSNGVIELNIDETMDQVPGGTYFLMLRAIGPGGASDGVLSPLFSK